MNMNSDSIYHLVVATRRAKREGKDMAKAQQKRAIATRENILDALERMLEMHEFEAISIAELAREAGVAVGSVYSHFKDKDALLPGLLDRQLERVKARIAELEEHGTVDGISLKAPMEGGLRGSIEYSIQGAYRQITQTKGLRRALMTYRRLNPDLTIPVADRLAEQAFDAVVQQLELHKDDIVHEDIREAAKMVNYFINVMFLDQVVFLRSPFPEDLRPSHEAMIEAYTDMVYNYLTIG